MSFRFLSAALALALMGLFTLPAEADSRRFTYIYEASVMDEGEAEFEQYLTHKTRKKNDTEFDRLDIKTEIEYGLGDNAQMSVIATWRYQDGASVSNNTTQFKTVGLEYRYLVADPTEDPLGVLLYGEVALGDEKAKVEGKLILQKNVDKWIFAWNGVFEAEWEGENHSEDKGVIKQLFGASYQVDPSLSVGIELLHEFEIDDWTTVEDAAVYGGPNVAYRGAEWWVTLTTMFQLTSIDGEPDLQTRIIFGFDF